LVSGCKVSREYLHCTNRVFIFGKVSYFVAPLVAEAAAAAGYYLGIS
jgi:hypothetical protein